MPQEGPRVGAAAPLARPRPPALVEHLADEHLEVRLDRRDDDVRTVRLVPHGPGWAERIGG